MRIFLTGASGLLGQSVSAALLRRGDAVTALSRKPRKSEAGGVHWVAGDPAKRGDWCREIDGHDAVVHLAGESIASGRWTESRKQRIASSRIDSTRLIVEAIEGASSPPPTFVCASATGYYGSRGEELLDEHSAPGNDYLARVCQDWEAAAQRPTATSLRAISIRFSVILSANGGALSNMLLPFRLGLGGPLGPKERWFPWIHEADATGLVLHAIDTPEYLHDGTTRTLNGPVNAVAPGVVRMGEFASTLGEVLHRPALLPVPLALLRIPLGELATLLSPGQRVSCDLAIASGYRFVHPDLADALRACLE